MGIEIVEYVSKSGLVAEIVGGKQKVSINFWPAHMQDEYWTNPNVNCTRPSWKVPARMIPATYVVERENGGRTGYKTYNEAVEAALKSAARKPRKIS